MRPITQTIGFLFTIVSASLVHAGTSDDIAKRAETFEAAFNSGDAVAVASHYTENAVILAPDTPRIDGRDAILGLWQAYIDAGVKDLQLTTAELEDLGDTALEIGTYSLSAPDGNGGMVQADGKYVIVWKVDEGGTWHLHWDIWNSTP